MILSRLFQSDDGSSRRPLRHSFNPAVPYIKMIHFVVHEEGDGVGVVVVEGVKAGQQLNGWIMEDDKDVNVTAKNDIPTGHKPR